MWLLGFILIFSLYVGLQTLALTKAFANVDTGKMAVTMALSGVLAIIGVLMNGMFPPIPLTANDMWPFIIMLFLGQTAFNAIALNLALDNESPGLLGSGLVSAVLNLVLCIVLGAPLFFMALESSNLLFK